MQLPSIHAAAFFHNTIFSTVSFVDKIFTTTFFKVFACRWKLNYRTYILPCPLLFFHYYNTMSPTFHACFQHVFFTFIDVWNLIDWCICFFSCPKALVKYGKVLSLSCLEIGGWCFCIYSRSTQERVFWENRTYFTIQPFLLTRLTWNSETEIRRVIAGLISLK